MFVRATVCFYFYRALLSTLILFMCWCNFFVLNQSLVSVSVCAIGDTTTMRLHKNLVDQHDCDHPGKEPPCEKTHPGKEPPCEKTHPGKEPSCENTRPGKEPLCEITHPGKEPPHKTACPGKEPHHGTVAPTKFSLPSGLTFQCRQSSPFCI